MKEIKSDLSEVKPGMFIWSSRHGYKKVIQIRHDNRYPIVTDILTSTLCGRVKKDDLYPSIFLTNEYDPNDIPPISFSSGEIVMIMSEYICKWIPATFTKMHNNEYVVNVASSTHKIRHLDKTNIRKLSDIEKGISCM